METYQRAVWVVATQELTGADVGRFLTKWRNLNYDGRATLCDPQPAYRIVFHDRDRTDFATAELCFDCGNIAFKKNPPDGTTLGEMNFTKNNISNDLRAYLASLFPGHDPDGK